MSRTPINMPRQLISTPRTLAGIRTLTTKQIDLTGLVGWWKMRDSDFGTTTLTNEVAGGQNWSLTSPKWVSHGGRNALQYNQTSQSVGSITVVSGGLLDMSSAISFSIIGRVNFVGLGGNSNGRLFGSSWIDHVVRQGSINSQITSVGTSVRWGPAIAPTDNTWIICLTYNSQNNTVVLSLDGVVSSTTLTNNSGVLTASGTGAIKLGADVNVTSVPSGFIYELAIFKNRVLTAAESLAFMTARQPVY